MLKEPWRPPTYPSRIAQGLALCFLVWAFSWVLIQFLATFLGAR